MARKASSETHSTHGFHDIIGLVLMLFAALLLFALLSYNPHDVSAHGTSVNHPAHNLICLLYLTNVRLGEWVRDLTTGRPSGMDGVGPASGDITNEEKVLEKRARELEKQARKLQEQVEKARAGLGADLKPVPEPTVRDLSVPQNKPAPTRPQKTASPERVKEPALPDEAVVIPAREVAAATSADVLGKKLQPVGN